MPIAEHAQVLASAAQTASLSLEAQAVPPGGDLRAIIAVTAVSGTSPTLDVNVQGQTVDGDWVTLATAAFTTATGATLFVELLPDTIRLDLAVGGTSPSFTLNVDFIIRPPSEVAL